jgi:hypothetical protein
MSKDQSTIESIVVDTQVIAGQTDFVKLDDLSLTMIGGGEVVVAL